MKEKTEPAAGPEKDKTKTENVFEVERIRSLVQLMEEHDLSEIDLREARHRIRICRGPQLSVLAGPQGMPQMMAPGYAPQSYAPPAMAGGANAGSAPAVDAGNIGYIKSPMVGTFYSRPNPKSEAYLKVGDQIDPTTVICIIEAMKVFNEIPAEVKGQVVEILVQDGESVEFEKPLFKIALSK